MPPAQDITLIVGGLRFTGWTDVEISRSIDEFSDAWSLRATTRWAVVELHQLAIELDRGDAAEVWYGEIEIIRGWVEEISEVITADSWTVTISGRSRAGDLVDCSAMAKGAWLQSSARQIAADLVAPFSLLVRATLPELDAPIRRFAADAEETVADTLRRLGLTLGLRVRSTPRGDVEFFRPAAGPVAARSLAWGRNVRQISRKRSDVERFSTYVTRVQVSADDDLHGAAASIAAAVDDAGMLRYRPLRIHAERGGTADELRKRAEWERNTRAGRGDMIEVDVYDAASTWLAGPTATWEPGHLVTIYAPPLDLDGRLLISAVTLGYGSAGWSARLALTHPEAYQPERPPTKRKKKGAYTW